MASETILIVEDETDIADLVRLHLAREGYRVLVAADGSEGLRLALTRRPALVILDLMLPERDGLEVCRALRASESMRDCGIVMLTARDAESDVVLGLEMGADDYVSKPFSTRELMGRVRAVLRSRNRRAEPVGLGRIEMGDVLLDAQRHELSVRGEPVVLTRAEFRLLWTLCAQRGRVYSRDELVDSITAGESVILGRNVDVHVSTLRRKLGSESALLQTVRGVGYRARA